MKRTLGILTNLYGGAARERQQQGCISNGDVEEPCDSDVEEPCDSDAEESIDGDETTRKGEPRRAILPTATSAQAGVFRVMEHTDRPQRECDCVQLTRTW